MNAQSSQFQRAWIRSNKLFNTQIRICQQVEWAQKRTNELPKGRITHQSYCTTMSVQPHQQSQRILQLRNTLNLWGMQLLKVNYVTYLKSYALLIGSIVAIATIVTSVATCTYSSNHFFLCKRIKAPTQAKHPLNYSLTIYVQKN